MGIFYLHYGYTEAFPDQCNMLPYCHTSEMVQNSFEEGIHFHNDYIFQFVVVRVDEKLSIGKNKEKREAYFTR